MNRLAIHESVAADLEPTELITVAQQSGFDSVGLKVAHGPGAQRWWSKGAGAEELVRMVDHLLASRVSVLDIGRVELGDLPDAVVTTESYRGVLDLGTRLGAHSSPRPRCRPSNCRRTSRTCSAGSCGIAMRTS